jgi:hypothetical protein
VPHQKNKARAATANKYLLAYGKHSRTAITSLPGRSVFAAPRHHKPVFKVDSHLTTRQARPDNSTTEKLPHFHINDATQDAVFQKLPDLLLALCCRQVACSELFSEEELICTAVILHEEKRKSRKRKWVHASLKEGQYFTLYNELVEDSVRFHQYFRIPESMFLNCYL